jgi:hypothetical protein
VKDINTENLSGKGITSKIGVVDTPMITKSQDYSYDTNGQMNTFTVLNGKLLIVVNHDLVENIPLAYYKKAVIPNLFTFKAFDKLVIGQESFKPTHNIIVDVRRKNENENLILMFELDSSTHISLIALYDINALSGSLFKVNLPEIRIASNKLTTILACNTMNLRIFDLEKNEIIISSIYNIYKLSLTSSSIDVCILKNEKIQSNKCKLNCIARDDFKVSKQQYHQFILI